jgi:hypothetical protein
MTDNRIGNLSLHDVEADGFTVATHYSIDRINKTMDYCKERHNSGDHSVLGGDKLIATVDPAIVHLWISKHGITMPQFMADPKIAKRFLEDPDNSNFRIWKGAL